jgi:HlyD family secretion protein
MGVVLVLLVLAAAGAWWWWHDQRPADPALVLFGDVDIREVMPAFNASGAITALLVQEGERVRRGQVIATLDDRRTAASLAQAEGQLRAAGQTLARMRAGSRPEEIEQAEATMRAAETVWRNDAANAQRYVRLVPSGSATMQQRDDALAAAAAAQQNYQAARQAWVLAVKGPRAEDIDATAGSYDAAVAAVALARRQHEDTTLLAPSDGVVESRIMEPGDMASPATPVVTIALDSPLWVRAYVAESALGRVPLGAAAEVRTDSFPDHVYHGWVGYLSPTAEFTPKSVETAELRTGLVYQLRVYVCDARGELRLGMPATVRVLPVAAGATPAATPGCGPGDAAGN